MASLKGKVYAITGGASGIGLATAELLSQREASVCIADIDVTALSHAEALLSTSTSPVSTTKVDVSKREEVDAWIAGIIDRFGRLDGAANIAGVIGRKHGMGTLAELEDDEWDRIMSVNLTGCMYCLRAELRCIVDGGSIVNMASLHGTNAQPYHAAYGASKHGIIALTRSAAKEVGAREIRVNAVAPGPIYTPLMQLSWDQLRDSGRPPPEGEPVAFGRQGRAEEVAQVIVFLLGPESSYVSGSVYAVDGGWL